MIYFVQGGKRGLVKIGLVTLTKFAPNITRRLAQLQAASADKLYLIATMDGDCRVEHDIQRKFRQYHSHGEWFYPDRTLMKWIRDNGSPCCQRAETPIPFSVR